MIEKKRTPNAHILVLDDDHDIQRLLETVLTSQGYFVSSFKAAKEALDYLNRENEYPVDLIISDLRIPEIDGLSFISKVKEMKSQIPVIFMTAYGSVDTAIHAIRLGAFDYLRKPFEPSEVILSVKRVLNHHALMIENRMLSEEINKKWELDSIVGKSQPMLEIFDLIKRVSPTTANILITGESGTGKEMIARAIHQNSPRANKPFLAVNCAAIPESLLESELFGHAKGSFTNASQNRRGLFEEANGGTILLDEIGDMTMALQAKMLRVLQDKKVKPVGENIYKQVDVRILAATHRDLRVGIKKNEFREDLFYRLNVISINVPTLRERPEDIILLTQHFLRKYAAIHHSPAKTCSREAMSHLMAQRWPGNIRELENAIERAVVLCQGNEIQVSDLTVDVPTKSNEEFQMHSGSEYLSLEDLKMRYINFILGKTGGRKEQAARILKIDRTTLHRKLKEAGIQDNDKESSASPFEELAIGL